MKSESKQLQNHIYDMTTLAKSIWYYELSYKLLNININSWLAWECIDILKGGEKAHNNNTQTRITKKEYVTIAKNDK